PSLIDASWMSARHLCCELVMARRHSPHCLISLKPSLSAYSGHGVHLLLRLRIFAVQTDH
ncbi:MAG: hypothetical protein WB764_16720, partial [Xanthobacteraceae bacterium]